MNKKFNVLVVGGGMYVVGYGSNNYGTIIPALLEARRNDLVDRIGIVTTNPLSADKAKKRTIKLAKKMGVSSKCDNYPKDKTSDKAFLVA